MNAWLGVALALAALVAGGALLGWQGVVFAMTGIVFWLLLQMSRLMRIMKLAGSAPMGSLDNAVMLNAKLHAGMRLVDLLQLTRSLGIKQGKDAYRWQDGAGDAVEVQLAKGRLVSWQLRRAQDGEPAP